MPDADARSRDDLDLARRCVLGDPAAWERLVRDHVPILHAAVARVVGARDAEDVLQRVFLKLWEDGRRRLATFRGRSRLSTWLVAVARREALDRSRVDAGRAVAPPEARNGHAPPVDLMASAREGREAVLSAIERLPPRDRLLVRLVYVDARSYADVARLLSVPENSISPWLQRARVRLAATLEPGAERARTPASAAPLQRNAIGGSA